MPLINVAGETLFYAEYNGDITRRHNLVLVHGAGGSHIHWPAELRRLPGANVYALDLPAHGRSGGYARATLQEYADTVHFFVLVLGLSRAAVLGHSMGGAIVQLLALRRPPWLEKVVIAGSAARLRVQPDILEFLNPQSGQDGFEKALDLICQRIYGPQASPQMRLRGRQLLRAVSPAVLYADYLACAHFDCSELVGNITLPTLVICGSDDRMIAPEESCGLSQRIPHAQLVTIQGAGHMMMVEKPSEVAEAVARFLGVA
ncbi:MAG: alpha/beta hydrolase [Ardenticatenia bacterium]|jgi:pimeloyl-ACP methyl ester carboxylesterase|nr:MAG: alpha/beta hydrolase [Ardenticatenia bacterium]